MMIRALLFALLTASSFAISACGLSPVYGSYADGGTDAPVAKGLDSVYIDTIPDRTGQKLRNKLIDRMVQSGGMDRGSAAYTLKIGGLSESIYGIGIAKDATATRSQINLSATLNLIDTKTGNAVLERKLTSVASFNRLSSQYTTLVTEEDAREQAISDLSNRIITQLELYFANPSAFVKSK